ncbi:hypothetical protein JCM11251_000641 [Rhodosporidiobolus azoricus]
MHAPVASTSATSGGFAASDGETNGSGVGRQPRKRGRKRIDEDLSQIKGNDSLDAEAKRKLQNRAAQRAFRERKEKHLSDLETRVVVQEQQLQEFSEIIQSLIDENEALHRGERPVSSVSRASAALASFRSNAPSSSTASPPPPSVALSAPSHSHIQSPEDVKPSVPRDPAYAPAATDLPSALLSTSLPPVAASTFLPQTPPDYTASLPRDLTPPRAEEPPSLPPPVGTVSRAPGSPLAPPASSLPPPPLDDVDMSFDFDAPFTFDDTTLPPLFTTMIDELLAAPLAVGLSSDPSLAVSVTTDPSLAVTAAAADDDDCGCEDPDDPPPLPLGRIPCDKPECDFTAQSCLLPIPWRPPMAIGTDKDLWVAQKCWAKLVSHPLFGLCDSDELCQELRDKTRCSDDGRLVVPKSDVCDIFRAIPAKARARQEQVAVQ